MPQDKSKRDYKKEYARDHASKKKKRQRAMRNKARKTMEKIYGKEALKGKDVDHKRPLSRGGSNSRSNLRVMSIKKNRGRNN